MAENNSFEEDVDQFQVIEELSDRLDALVELLEDKGVISDKEYTDKVSEVLSRKEEQ